MKRRNFVLAGLLGSLAALNPFKAKAAPFELANGWGTAPADAKDARHYGPGIVTHRDESVVRYFENGNLSLMRSLGLPWAYNVEGVTLVETTTYTLIDGVVVGQAAPSRVTVQLRKMTGDKAELLKFCTQYGNLLNAHENHLTFWPPGATTEPDPYFPDLPTKPTYQIRNAVVSQFGISYENERGLVVFESLEFLAHKIVVQCIGPNMDYTDIPFSPVKVFK